MAARQPGRRPPPSPRSPVSQRKRSLLGMEADLPSLEGRRDAAGQHHVLGRAGDDFSARHQQPDDIGRPQRQLEIVRRDDDGERAAARQPAQQSHQLDARGHVEKGRRLVEHQQHRLLRQRARDHHALSLAVGHAGKVAIGEVTGADRVDRPRDDLAIAVAQPAEPAGMRIASQFDDLPGAQRLDGDALGQHDAETPREIRGRQ